MNNHHRFVNLDERSIPSLDEENIINLRRVSKQFATAAGTFTALDDIDLQIATGEFVGIVGKSGSGKSTLLNLIAGIDTVTKGEVFVAGTAVHTLNQNQSALWRGRAVGVIFQFFQLIPTLTVSENVMLPMDFGNTYPTRRRRPRALDLLDQVGVVAQADKLPALLSGGEKQRVAIARALVNDPPVLLADEPTGNLDSQTADATLALFQSFAETGKTVVMVTHERDVSRWVSRTVTLADGQITGDSIIPATAPAERAVAHG
jgi:putative ABC transport system ATP-binding protein